MRIFHYTLTPRFCETDALGHINNTTFPIWCEAAKQPIFEIFNPGQALAKWNLIVASIHIDFMKPCFFPHPVEIQTKLLEIKRSSFIVHQRIEQNMACVAEMITTIVHYDFATERSQPIPDDIRLKLAPYCDQTSSRPS